MPCFEGLGAYLIGMIVSDPVADLPVLTTFYFSGRNHCFHADAVERLRSETSGVSRSTGSIGALSHSWTIYLHFCMKAIRPWPYFTLLRKTNWITNGAPSTRPRTWPYAPSCVQGFLKLSWTPLTVLRWRARLSSLRAVLSDRIDVSWNIISNIAQ